jgi:cytochrome P450
MYIYHDNISEATDTMARFPRWVLSLTSMSNGPITLMSNCREYTKRVAEIVEEVLKRPDTKDAVHGINGLLPEDKKQDYLLQARSQIGLSLAAFNTTVRALYNVIFDLVEHPENLRILREELFDVFCTNYSGKLPRYTIDKFDRLLKMDSVIKESMRLHGGDVGTYSLASCHDRLLMKWIGSFRRKLLRGVTLSDGTHLPEGTTLLSPTWSLSHDASIFPDPDTFDGLRFFNMPPASRPQLTTVDNTATYFGAGRHACPGRAFASRKIKMFLIHLLMSYDLKLVDGDTEPRDSQSDGILAPNREKNIMIRNLRTL